MVQKKKKKKDLRGCYIYRRSPFNRIIQGREEARLNSRRELFTVWRGSHRTVRFKIFSFRVFFFFSIYNRLDDDAKNIAPPTKRIVWILFGVSVSEL